MAFYFLCHLGKCVTSMLSTVAMLVGSGFVSEGSLRPPPFLHVNYGRVKPASTEEAAVCFVLLTSPVPPPTSVCLYSLQ